MAIKIWGSYIQENGIFKKQIKISDEIFSKRKHRCCAYFHFHPDLKIDNIDNTITIQSYSKITFKNFDSLKIKEYNYSLHLINI